MMAVRVQNGAVMNFGTFGAAETATHGRMSIGECRGGYSPARTNNRDIAVGRAGRVRDWSD